MTLLTRSLASLLLTLAAALQAQQGNPKPLDPTKALPFPAAAQAHTPLPEQYVWTAGDVTALRPDRSKYSWARQDLRIDPHYFRTHFTVAAVPSRATFYVAGPREAHVFLNGHALADFRSNLDAPIGFHVFHTDASSLLRTGDNVLAISAVRGRGVVSGAGPVTTQQLAYGEVLVAKIVPAAFGVEAPALVLSDMGWNSSSTAEQSWQSPAFDDHAWLPVQSLGSVEGDLDLLQWSADAGMYGWPGYRGMSAPLRTYALPAAAVSHVYPTAEAFSSLSALISASPFAVHLASLDATDADSPAVLLDFGREVAGRLLVESDSDRDAVLSVAYGESELEAMATGLTPLNQGGNYLGTNLLDVPAHGVARGPKSAFRYVRLRFLRGAPLLALRSIKLEGIYYPVSQQGSFESSDPLLNRIWETGAYTVHLCMQDGLWDAPKRDRGRWVGDIDVEGRVILTAFGDPLLIEDTLRRLAEATPPGAHVNGIAGYTALWITSLQTLYQHTGDKPFLDSQHKALLQLLARMDQDLGPDSLITPGTKGWGFVDWAPGLYGYTDGTRMGTNLQYLRGYEAGARLLNALGDKEAAQRYGGRAKTMAAATGVFFDRSQKESIGSSWQLNSLAVLTRPPDFDKAPFWVQSLAQVKQDSPADQGISPYFGAYLLDAMAQTGHAEAALAWVRTYWGGMLAEGATSFWESYDLRWPKNNYHLSLQADGTSGYFVSLAHGWSAGPTAWLTENVLGVTPAAPGYDVVSIAPRLFDLDYVRGSVPTPHGIIGVDDDKRGGLTISLPANVRALVDLSVPPAGKLYVDGAFTTDRIPTLTQPGQHHLEIR